MLALQLVAPLGKGIEDLGMVEAMREVGVRAVARDRVEVVEELVHPAVLDLQHAGHVLRR